MPTLNNGSAFGGTDFPNGFNPGSAKPLDVRLVVTTKAQRNNLLFTYPGMVVTILGTAVGTEYPNQTHWRLKFARTPNFTGATTTDSDWRQSIDTSGANYKGAWNATTNVPDLTDDPLRSALLAGDYWRVNTAGSTDLDGITTWTVGDTVIWNGSSFDRLENTSPPALIPLYLDTESTRFDADVNEKIRLKLFPAYLNQAYLTSDVVREEYESNGIVYVRLWQAVFDMGANSSLLPTPVTPNSGWRLLASSEGTVRNDARGKAAILPVDTKRTDEYLSPQEVDARIAQYGGGGNILGGNAASFLTASPTEVSTN